MHVAVLSPYPDQIVGALKEVGDTWSRHDDIGEVGNADFVVSYGHRQIIRQPEIDRFGDRLINLHIAYLPWNRGADPNLWSFIDGTPKGVTIHVVDTGLDTGAIIGQREVKLTGTLATSYSELREAMADLFGEIWPFYRAGMISPVAQAGVGSYHRSTDKTAIMARLPLGYDTPIEDLQSLSGR